MNNEIEALFLGIDKERIRTILKKIGAELRLPETLMKKVVFDTGEHSFARIRDEGDKIVMTYKNYLDENSILGVKEVNLEVDSYDNAILFLQGCGLTLKAKQETKREVWELNGVEICIDTWPWLPTYIEVEGPTEDSVWETAEKLELKKEDAKFGAADRVYQHYYGVEPEIVNDKTPEITFSVEAPEWVRAT